MSSSSPLRFAGLAFALFSLILLAPAAQAEEAATLQVTNAWARWLPADLPSAGYLTLGNPGPHDVVLTGASSPDYKMVHVHESYTTDSGAKSMRMIERLPVPAGGTVQLLPGGYHLMLMRALHPVKPGDTVTVILRFADGQTLTVPLPVKPAGTQ